MIIASTIKHLLQNKADYIGLDPDTVYSYSIPDDCDPNHVKSVVIRISEISDSPATYGSNRSISSDAFGQVQMFFPRTYTGDTSVVREKTRAVMENNDWYCSNDFGMKRDPDTFMMSNTAYYHKQH